LIGTAAPEPRTPPPWEPAPEDEDDIPVIEATAEPGALASNPPPATVTAPTAPVPVPPANVPTVEISADLIQISSLPPLEPSAPAAPPLVAVHPPPAPPRPLPGPDRETMAQLVEPIVEPFEIPTRRVPYALLGVGAVLLVLAAGGLVAYRMFGDRTPGGTSEVAHLPHEDPTLIASTSRDAGAGEGAEAPTDAGPEGARDGAERAPGAEEDAGVDAADAGIDGGVDGGMDAGPLETAGIDEEPEDDEGDTAAPSDELRRLIRSGNYERNRNRLPEAEREYLRALRLDRRNARALAGLTKVAIGRRDGTQAVRWGRRLVQTGERNANNHVLLGDAYRAAGNRRAAQQSWRRALELSPDHRTAQQRLLGTR
jgi:hypothetical protein